ncbi:CHAT domain-containing protein [Argonema galeatum]|uniref:CHAT domain-containing protein n=1 Tax=Argonema galeatum TaxID=2942762 RepID=UPI0020114F37|nr:CHAT domain-containing tetratricopeptide repeat protein [Argonema galeatum]MCL1467220.1 tetratricopeptide repeat protein [Argonema galeatum A003/A1]
MFAKIWRWLKKLWQQLLGKPPQPSPPGAGTPGGKPNPRLSDAEFEKLFLQLLDRVEEDASRQDIKDFLFTKLIDEDELAAWLRRFGSKLLESPETHRELGRRMVQLGKVAGGELGDVAGEIGRELLGNSETQTSIVATSVIPTVDKQIADATNLVSDHIKVDREAEESYNRGGDEYKADNIQTTISSDEKLIEIKSDSHKALRDRGTELAQLGRYEEAIDSYDKAIEIKSDDVWVWYARGNMLVKLERYEEAIVSYDKALEIDPNGIVWMSIGRALADVSYDKALEIKPDSYQAWFERGSSLFLQGRYEEAVSSFDKAIELKPNDHQCWKERGDALECLGFYQEAIANYDKAIELKPNDHQCWKERGDALERLGFYQEAIANYDKAIELIELHLNDKTDDMQQVFLARCNALKKAGRYEEAIINYDKLIEINPNSSNSWLERAELLRELGLYEEAINNYDKVIEITYKYNSEYSEAWQNRGNLLNDLGFYEEALCSYDKLIERNSKDFNAWKSRGDVLKNLERYEEANASYEKALEIELKADYILWANRASLLTDLNRYEEAISSYDEEIRLIVKDYQETRRNGISKLLDHLAILHSTSWLLRGLVISTWQGDEAEIKNLDDGIKAHQQQMPDYLERCGELYYEKGTKQYNYGKKQPNPFPYWFEAKESYTEALKLLNFEKFPQRHLEILRDFLKVCSQLGDTKTMEEQLEKGTQQLEELVRQCEFEGQKISLARKFAAFNQLRVDILVQSSDRKKQIEALELAEKRKNTCLQWLYSGWDYQLPSPKYQEMQKLLNSKTAAIYWHYSPAAITTFIIKHDDIQIHSPENTAIQQLQQFEDWLKEWKEDYQTNRKDAKEEKESWREKMADRLDELGKILDVEGILNKIGDDITHLILIPHRDLHLLPVHYLLREKDFTITYLPSLKVGIDLSVPPSPVTKLLSIENPQDLLFALVESSAIARLFPECDRIPSQNATISVVRTSLKNAEGCFHFTGHAYHDPNYPRNSALILASEPNLTLADIFAFNTLNLQLVCLAACETGITGKEGLIDEFVGLASGFLATGVNYVVSSLWRVEERSTALLMMQFYHYIIDEKIIPAIALNKAQNWLRQLTYGELAQWYLQLASQFTEKRDRRLQSLLQREAQRLLNSAKINLCDRPYEEPYYWAGFILTGAF